MSSALTAEFIRQRLADLPEVMPDLRLLVLFGSAARDGASDIDLAVQCDGPPTSTPSIWPWPRGSEPIVWT